MVHPVQSRMMALAVLAALLAPLAVAGGLEPDEHGVGTHRQLGMSSCALLVLTGVPCPTCGMTTACALAVRGRWMASLRTQPAGCLLAASLMIGALVTVAGLMTGNVWSINWFRVRPLWAAAGAVLFFIAAWGYKIIAVRNAAG